MHLGRKNDDRSGTKITSLALMLFVSCLTTASASQFTHSVEPKPGVDRVIQVPFLYEHREQGTFSLEYELGRPFDSHKPTVIVVADGQQFYVRKGLVAPLQDELFGDKFNVVGIIGRGSNDAVLHKIEPRGTIDWCSAYEILKSDEWIEDIDSVRTDLVGSKGRISLYGRSGGALLVHEYLAKHSQHVVSVFTQSAVNRFLEAEFGLNSDTFWDEIGRYGAELQRLLLDGLSRHVSEKNRIFLLLQRQNFFVPAEDIAAERSRLIHVLHDWDETQIAKLSKDYQVDAILGSINSDPASRIRVFELFAPILASRQVAVAGRVDPDLEVGALFAEPLLQLIKQGRLQMPSMNFQAIHNSSTDVYMIAGRFDHTADYRTQIALASHYPNHRLLILADNHNFLTLRKTGLYPQLVQAAIGGGIHGPEKAGIEQQLRPLIYREY